MKRACAWCRKDLGVKESEAGSEELISHSICDSCRQKFFAATPQGALKDLLDRFPKPIMAIDSSTRIITANEPALGILNKKMEQVVDRMGGDALECPHAKLPGGCGRTEHCKGCTIRIIVTETMNTGKAQTMKTALQSIQRPEGVQQVRFLISTEKLQDAVFLTIEKIDPA